MKKQPSAHYNFTALFNLLLNILHFRRSVRYLIRYDGMGDALWMEPLIRRLAADYPKVVVVTHHVELFRNYPFPNVSFQPRLKKREKLLMWIGGLLPGPGVFVNLNGSYEARPKQHILYAFFEKAGIPPEPEYPRIYLNGEESGERVIAGRYALLHLENSLGKNYRNIYGVNWNVVAGYLVSKGYRVIQIGRENKQIAGTSYFPTPGLRDLVKLISRAALFIGMDSGPSHIAAALHVPALVFFGAVNPLYRHFPAQFAGYFLQQPCEFAGCYHEVTGTSGQTCRLVGDDGIPPCSLHSDEYVLGKIDQLIKHYIENDKKVHPPDQV